MIRYLEGPDKKLELDEYTKNKLHDEYPGFQILKFRNWKNQFSPYYIFRILYDDDVYIAEIINDGNSVDVFHFLDGWEAAESFYKIGNIKEVN